MAWRLRRYDHGMGVRLAVVADPNPEESSKLFEMVNDLKNNFHYDIEEEPFEEVDIDSHT